MEQDDIGQNEATPTSPTDNPVADEPQQPTQNPPTGQPEGDDFETQTSDEVPEGIQSEHARKRFHDLSEKAKTAEQELQDLRQRKSVFDEFMPQAAPVPQPQQPIQPPQLSQFTDSQGNVDIQRFDEAQRQYYGYMQQNIVMGQQQAMQYAQQMDRRIQEKEAYSKFPELDPTAKDHDDKFKRLVAATMAMDWANGVNRPLVDVANEVAESYAKRQSDEGIKKQAVEQYKEAQQERATQGPMERGRTVSRTETPIDRLKEISVQGTMEQEGAALAERLRRAKS